MSEQDLPTWDEGRAAHSYPPLEADTEADVVIVGGGLAGMLTAYLLARAGKKPVVLEADRIGAGATAFTTAFLTQVIDMDLAEMVDLYDDALARNVWQSGIEAIDVMEEIIEREKIDCEFMRCSMSLYADRPHDAQRLAEEAKIASRLGLEATFHAEGDLGFSHHGYLEIPNQAKFNATRFVQALADRAVALGARVFEQSAVLSLTETGPVEARTDRARVRAKMALVSTHLPFNKPKQLFFQKAQYVSYVLEAKTASGAIPEGLYVDSGNPYHYIRVDRFQGYDRVLVGGEDHRRDFPVSQKKSFRSLARALDRLLPETPYQLVREWRGPLIESVDRLPFIGTYAPDRFVATAFSGNGMTFAAATALIVSGRMSGQAPRPWEQTYAFPRKQTPYQMFRHVSYYLKKQVGGALKNTLGILPRKHS